MEYRSTEWYLSSNETKRPCGVNRGVKKDFTGYIKTTPRELVRETVFRGILFYWQGKNMEKLGIELPCLNFIIFSFFDWRFLWL